MCGGTLVILALQLSLCHVETGDEQAALGVLGIERRDRELDEPGFPLGVRHRERNRCRQLTRAGGGEGTFYVRRLGATYDGEEVVEAWTLRIHAEERCGTLVCLLDPALGGDDDVGGRGAAKKGIVAIPGDLGLPAGPFGVRPRLPELLVLKLELDLMDAKLLDELLGGQLLVLGWEITLPVELAGALTKPAARAVAAHTCSLPSE
jgi:hypothetical protein